MKKTLFVVFLFVSFSLAPAVRAEVFVWKDPEFKIRMTFPDNWMRQAQTDDNMRLFILAPQGTDHAACRLYASHDGRYMDAPAWAGSAVSNMVFGQDAVRDEIIARPDTYDVNVASFSPTASLGRGAATLTEVGFTKKWAGNNYKMHGMVLATQYHGDHILMSCETLENAWAIWEPTIKSIFKSVDYAAAFTPEPNGMYRRFQDDGDVFLPVNRRRDGYGAY